MPLPGGVATSLSSLGPRNARVQGALYYSPLHLDTTACMREGIPLALLLDCRPSKSTEALSAPCAHACTQQEHRGPKRTRNGAHLSQLLPDKPPKNKNPEHAFRHDGLVKCRSMRHAIHSEKIAPMSGSPSRPGRAATTAGHPVFGQNSTLSAVGPSTPHVHTVEKHGG